MDKESLKIVFMGTPDFAVESLRALVDGGYRVVGVVTMPDKPSGRGYQVRYSSVKEYALSKGLPLLQPEKLKDAVFLEELKAWNADLQIVVAFRMLPEVVWNMPRLGTFNLHASLLPQYRGAAPINWAVINGEKETGITTFFLTHEIDTGEIISQEKVSIGETDNAEIIHDRLMHLGSSLVVKTVHDILSGTIRPVPQEILVSGSPELKPAPKIFKETCEINWAQGVENVYNFIRGLSSYPAAWTEIETSGGYKLNLKVFDSEKRPGPVVHAAGTVVSDGKTFIDVAVTDGYIRLTSIQQAGKKRMLTPDFLRGNGHLFN